MSTEVLDLVSDDDAPTPSPTPTLPTPASPPSQPSPSAAPTNPTRPAALQFSAMFSDSDTDNDCSPQPSKSAPSKPPAEDSDESDEEIRAALRDLNARPLRPRPTASARPTLPEIENRLNVLASASTSKQSVSQSATRGGGRHTMQVEATGSGVNEGEDEFDTLDEDMIIDDEHETGLYQGQTPDGEAGMDEGRARALFALNNISSDASKELPTPTEMSVLLLKHQRQAFAWMVERERSHRDKPAGHPRGGILADDQGFGKTLSTIALMVHNTPSKVAGCDTTPAWGNLIITPTSIMQQWAAELESRIDEQYQPRVLIYHGTNKVKDPYVLVKYDIVITSYATLAQEYPKVLERDHKRKPILRRRCGPLFKIKWFRVVLDEAQAIKNFRAESFRACSELKATRRWSLTGTPIQNTIDDIYAQFIFLRYFVVESYKEWKKQYKRPLEGKCSEMRRAALFKQFQTILGVVLLRRAKTDKIDGKPVIALPARNTNIMELQFSRTERAYYRAQEIRAVRDMHLFGIEEGFTSALVILLRLRQACGHPALCDWEGERQFNFSDDELDSVEVRMKKVCLFTKLPEAVQRRLSVELGPGTEVAQTCPICMDIIEEKGIVTKCGHIFCTSDFEEWQKENDTCPTCRTAVGADDDKMTLAGVREEIHALDRRAKRQKTDDTEVKPEVKVERKPRIKIQMGGKRSPSPSPEENPPKRSRDRRSGSSSASSDDVIEMDIDTNGEKEDEEDEDATKRTATSTKIKAFIEEYRKIYDTTEDKVLCFSQWTRMLALVEIRLKEEGFEYVRLDGTMSVDQRSAVIRMFKNRTKCRLFLISLKAGSTGLNLTAANRVFLLDSWWNPAVEDQAIDRVHRIGQTKDVEVIRFKIENSVEDRILDLQEKKRTLINNALGDEGLKTMGRRRLTMQDVLGLFRDVAMNVANTGDEETAGMAQQLLDMAQSGY